MVSNQPKILVVGATGKFARWVIPELMRRDAVVHALVRNDARAAVARSLGVAEVFIGDLRNTDSLAEATRGMDGVFHIGPRSRLTKQQWGLPSSRPQSETV